jgi:hypothetical protein
LDRQVNLEGEGSPRGSPHLTLLPAEGCDMTVNLVNLFANPRAFRSGVGELNAGWWRMD